MNHKIPNTPFSTRFSGSAKETKIRLHSIFQWKKKRPPVIILLIAIILVLMCCALVSCQMESSAPDDENETPDVMASYTDFEPKITLTEWEGEEIVFPRGEFSIRLPVYWIGKVGYVIEESSISFFHLGTREIEGWENAGLLFRINKESGYYPVDRTPPLSGTVIAASNDYSYVIWEGFGEQCPSYGEYKETIYKEYSSLASPYLKFTYSDDFLQSGAEVNKGMRVKVVSGGTTKDIYRCDDVYIYEGVPTHGIVTIQIPSGPLVYEIGNFSPILCDDGCNVESVMLRATGGYAPVYHCVLMEEFTGKYRTMRFAFDIPEQMVDSLKSQGVYERILVENSHKYFYLIELEENLFAYIYIDANYSVHGETDDETERVNEFVSKLEFEVSKNFS